MATKKTPAIMRLAKEVKVENAEVANWQAREDLECLQRAKEIESNRARLNAAKKMADTKIKALQRIKGK